LDGVQFAAFEAARSGPPGRWQELARDLEDAHIIEQEATNRILGRYDELAPK